MKWPTGLLVVVLALGFPLAGCGGEVQGEKSCLCAAGTTYHGSFYVEYANTTVEAEDEIGTSDGVKDCCDEFDVPRAPVYSVAGIDPTIAIATKSGDGTVVFHVAQGLGPKQQELADDFAKDHHSTP